MSYPEPRYFGNDGEVSAVYRSADAAPELASPSGMKTYYLATGRPTGREHGAATDGEFGLYNVVGLPPGAGTGTHFHKTMSESFFVTDGTVSLFDGERWVDGTKGDFLYVPPGGLHSFYNQSDEPASFLMLFTPGAPREGYFEGVGAVASLGEEERNRFFVEHDSYFTDLHIGPKLD
ncbi:cupin domain-containing protein [Actinomadura sp. 9N215]|uniref:cupin domain-containing protein n=1 Tax=Actinomadura sp. 9N215 TaxID=3375150 RepID=UPI0037A4BA9F